MPLISRTSRMKRIFVVLACIITECLCKNDAKILQGSEFSISEAPFIVSLLIRPDGPYTRMEDWQFLCAGVIIHDFVVLTSGSCVDHLKENELKRQDTLIRGNTDGWACACGRTKDHIITGYLLHENFKILAKPFQPVIYRHDIGVICVQERFTGIYEIPTAYKINFFKYGPLFGVGWGYSGKDGHVSDTLIIAPLFPQSKKNCNRIYKSKLPPEIFCVGTGGRDGNHANTCEYDVGGPILDLNFKYIGIISAGKDCTTMPSLCTNISMYTKWIEKAVLDCIS